MDEDGKFKQMSTATRQGAFIYLHGRCKEGELERGAMAEAARLFSVTHKAMALFWREMNKKIEDSFLDVDDVIANTLFFENDRTNRGRRPLWDRNELRVAVNRIWLTLMAVLNLIIDHHGGNDFRLPHLKKGVLDVAGQLPNSLTVTAAALDYLDGNN